MDGLGVTSQPVLFRRQQIGVASHEPPAILPMKHGQCMARARHRLGAVWGVGSYGESAPHEGPITGDFDLLNVARAVEGRCLPVGLSSRCCCELGLSHDRLAGDLKNDIVGHETQDSVNVAGLGRGHPRGHKLANLLLVVLHKQLRGCWWRPTPGLSGARGCPQVELTRSALPATSA